MLRSKMLAATAALAAVVLPASPAAALEYTEPVNCPTGITTLTSYDLDNPRKSGFQVWGKARVRQATCYKSDGSSFTGVWTEAQLYYVNDALKTTIGVRASSGNYYYMSDWDARGQDVWHDSPVLQRPAGANYTSSVATTADGTL